MEGSREKNNPAYATPETSRDESRESSSRRDDLIARRAYQRFEERGREHGHDLDDWLEAEREVGVRPGE
jgi:hypothetical protein